MFVTQLDTGEHMSKAPESSSSNTDKKKSINEATREDLAELPFMNTQRAELIVHYREAHGNFTDMRQIDNVTGIGEKLLQLIAEHFSV